MRIAVLHLGFFYAGGGERLVLEEARGLRQLGHEVECFAPVVDADRCYPELIAEVGVHRLLPDLPRWFPGRVAFLVLLSCLLAPVLALRFRNFDVILAANQPAPWIALVASRLLHKPYVAYLAQPNRVLYPRQVDLDARRPDLDYRLFALFAGLARPLVDWADLKSIQSAANVLANGNYMAGVLESMYGRQMLSCPAGAHPVPASELDYSKRISGTLRVGRLNIPKPYVLLTNRHYPQKRFDHALRALACVPEATLVLTGAPTDYTADVEELACRLGVRDRLLLTGLVSDSQLARLYASAQAYVYTAPEEDYGMGIVEAMGHGVPVVAWRSAGPTSTVTDGKTGFLVEPGDSDAFAGRLRDLLTDPALAARLGRAGWRRVNDGLGYHSHLRRLEEELAAARLAPPNTASASRRVLRPTLQVAFAVLLLALWSRTVPLADVAAHARPRHLLPLLVIPLLAFSGAVLRSFRWSLLLRPIARVRILDLVWINAAGGLLNYVLPIRSGDAARVWWLQRRHKVPAGAGLATILVDKTFDLAAVVLVLVATRGLWQATAYAGALLAVVVGVALGGVRFARSSFATRFLPERVAAGLGAQAFSFRAGARSLLSLPRVAAVSFLSLLALALDGVSFALLFRVLDLPVKLPAAISAYSALLLTYTVPSGPGYVGTLELAGTAVLATGLGLGAGAAAGAIVLWHAQGALLILATGLVGLNLVARPTRAQGEVGRVAIFHCGFTYSGGGERIVIEEVLGLRRLGYEVECFAPTVDPATCYPDLLPEVGVRTFLPQLPRWVPLRDALHMVLASALVPVYAWRFRRFDVIVGANQPGAWIAWCVARLTGRPHVVYLNQPNRLVYPRAIDVRTGWQTKRDYQLLNLVIQRIRGVVAWADRVSVVGASRLLVNGSYIGGIIRSIYGRDADDCPAGCHVEPGHPLPAHLRFQGSFRLNGRLLRRPFILLTNRHYPQKRFDLAIRAMAEVAKVHPQVQLVIPGEATSHTAALAELVRELGLGESVLFLGVIPEDELQRLYSEAAVYVYPAPEEDFGMGVIEAMAHGVPVVAWRNAGPTVTVASGETGYLAPLEDVGAYADGILRYLDDQALNETAGRHGHARARRFDWARHIQTLESAILAAAGARVVQPESETASAAEAGV